MYKTSSGVILEAVAIQDNGATIGIKEEYSVSTGESVRVKAVFGLDVSLLPTQPAYLQQGYQFVKLSDILMGGDLKDEMQKFLRSKRAVYSLHSVVYLLCSINGELNTVTGCWSPNTKIEFFSPKSLIDIPVNIGGTLSNGQPKKGVLCHQLSATKGISVITASPKYLTMLSQIVLTRMRTVIYAKDKFLFSRMGIYV